MASQFAVKARRGSLSSFRITFAFVLSLVALAILGGTAPADARPVQSSIVVDAATGEVLQASNADILTYPASLTKMMTLYLLFEALQDGRVKLTDTITFSDYAAGMSATNLNVDGGDRISVETAILALVVRSANDVAVAIAEHLGGTESGFARLMTNRAQMLGMTSTTFRNANGLPDPKQRTTARDMATLSVALIRDFPQYYGYFKQTSFKYHGVNFSGHNKLLKTFAGYDGIKTGYIRVSGFNLASSAERDGRRLVVVVMGGTSPSMRDRQVADLLTRGFRTQHGTGVLLAAKAPTGGQVKGAAPAPADSVVEDVIANILVKPAEADVAAEKDEAASGLALAGLKALAPMLKPGTGPKMASKPADAPAIAFATPKLKPGTGPKVIKLAEEPALAPDSQATTVVWKADGNYGVQVGAYSKYNAAQKAAQTATSAESLLADARIIIDTQKMNNGGKLYRARVAGLSKNDAQAACRNLKAKRTDCLVLRIDPTLAMGN
ncbi:MAG TPA: D-alanyl-D-alanine carboxypeptidase [Dongiaceae bacterium]|jgi:D-alanyl-D-alanine carboxypeptidase|nr:D-alanyl-D-alanine carboxypeptidase [Dongiaceae bacterium]